MHSPALYTVMKIPLGTVVAAGRRLELDGGAEGQYFVREQDNLLFRQIRLVTMDDSAFNKHIVFLDCKSLGKGGKAALGDVAANGFTLNGRRFVLGERSASMARNAILSFVGADISAQLAERATMGVRMQKTGLAKYYAYRGLLLSSCHCLEGWVPNIVIVPDCYRVLHGQEVHCLCDKEAPFTDKSGCSRVWRQKDVQRVVGDIEINLFDGCGIHHPRITGEVRARAGCGSAPTSIQWRAPFIKGMTHEADYVGFFADRGVTEVVDLWGRAHGVAPGDPPLAIMFESMYKGLKYFRRSGTYADWEGYWERFHQFGHCIGVSRWNFSLEEEPVYTRGNYQILQDLKIGYDDFARIANVTVDWIQKIIDGDPLHTYCFLGLHADGPRPLNQFAQAILKNPEMMKEHSVRNYFISLVEKKKDEMKCGKLFLKGSFKYLAPDLVMAMEHIGGLPLAGALEAGQFYARDRSGAVLGERLVERNPHICHAEHAVLDGVEGGLIGKYCPGLANVCMVDRKSLVAQRLNGADFD